jgi:alkanesulfonate monooxygenase SsuD/methylene tetrahydromethanopterin reductase-like flavin-dependent oxidoreductase (luciferase family)
MRFSNVARILLFRRATPAQIFLEEHTMELGLFMMPLHNLGRDYHATLMEDIEAVLYAEELGFSEYWCGEHYTSSVEPITSPLMFLAHVAAITKRIKLATGVACLPHHHPAMIGGEAAMLDQLSNGRFIFGVGPGGLGSDCEMMGTLEANRPEMVVESVEMMQKMWTTEPPYNIQGKYWSTVIEKNFYPDIGLGLMVPPTRKAGPPIAISAASPHSSTMKLAARKGWMPITANFIAEWSAATHWPIYAAEAAAAGRVADPDVWHVARSIHVADTDEEAEAMVKQDGGTFDWYFDYLFRIYDRGNMKGPVVVNEGDDPALLKHTEMRDNFVIYGSPETVTRKLLEFREKTGPFGTLLMAAHDWENKAAMKRSMELMAKDVMPAINAAIAEQPAALAAE